MNKEVKKKEEKHLLEEYIAPECEILALENETQLLAASPIGTAQEMTEGGFTEQEIDEGDENYFE